MSYSQNNISTTIYQYMLLQISDNQRITPPYSRVLSILKNSTLSEL